VLQSNNTSEVPSPANDLLDYILGFFFAFLLVTFLFIFPVVSITFLGWRIEKKVANIPHSDVAPWTEYTISDLNSSKKGLAMACYNSFRTDDRGLKTYR